MARAGGGRAGGSSGGGRSSSGSSSGGSRSFGSGGNRSFGGRTGGASPQRGGVSGGSSRGGTGYGSAPRPGVYGGPVYGPTYRRGPVYGGPVYGGGFYGPRRRRRPLFSSGGCGCLVLPIILILVVMIGSISLFAAPQTNQPKDANNVTKSTIERTALPAGAVNETGYYTDELGWIGNQTTLTAGMKNFYKETGVQPYLYITDTIAGTHSPTAAQVENFANDTYERLFTDEAHFLLIFFEYNEQYATWYLAGTQAKTVMDAEATDILLDYIDRYYYDQSMTDEQMFSNAFNEAGKRIMTVERSPWIPVLVVVGILAILLVVFWWWKQHKKQKNLEAEQTQEILNTPLETYGTGGAEDLAQKYDNNPDA